MSEPIKSLVAGLLWQTMAVKVSTTTPFKLASGNSSPIYVNCRVLISDPVAMDLITAAFHWICDRESLPVDCVAGGESAGIPFAAQLAARLAKPMVYVRRAPKDHGLGEQVEGKLAAGRPVLLVEDLITDGRSKLDFVQALRAQGAEVNHCVVVFDRLQGGRAVLESHGVNLHSLCDINVALAVAQAQGALSSDDLEAIKIYLADPAAWHVAAGLPYRQ